MSRMIPNWIDPLTRDSSRETPVYSVFDIESNNWIDHVVTGYYDGKEYKDYGSIIEFLDDVSKKRDDKISIFAHNGGGFDFNFILECIIKGVGRKNYKLEKVFSRGSTFLSIEVSNKKTGTTLIFRDSLAMLPFSLKSLTTNFKTECAKGEWDHVNDFKKRDDPRLLEYLKADCVGLYQVLDSYFSWPLIKEVGAAYTVASQALKVFRSFLDDRILGCSDSVDEFVRKGYFGGRTEVFRPYYKAKEPDDKLSCFDINSLYPSVMRDFAYPTRFKKWAHKYTANEFGFWEATVHVPKDMYVPPLGTIIKIDKKTKEVEYVADSSMGKFIFPTGTFSGVWSSIELEYAKSLGVKVLKVGKGAIFENGGHIFKDFIEELYAMRMRAEKDSVDSFICKLILNSCYGRFGLNLDRENIVQDDGTMPITGLTPYEFDTGERVNGIPIMERFVKVEERIQSFTNVAIAAWVTAQARIRMHREYMKNLDSLYYTDTDSMFVEDKGSIDSSKDLGKFKYEYSATEACFLLPKAYCLAGITGIKDAKGQAKTTKTVIKGINESAIKAKAVTVDDFFKLLDGEFKRRDKIPLPIEFVIPEKFSKVKTAMRKGTFLDVTEKSEKKFSAKYDKREIYLKPNGDYDTRPIYIENGVATNYRDPDILVIATRTKGNKVKFSDDITGYQV